MRYMTIVHAREGLGQPPAPLIDAIGRMAERGYQDGTLLQVGGLGPTAMGAKVTLKNGTITVTDGPFTEAKEVVGGFALWDLATKEEAVEKSRAFMDLHQKHWPAFEGVCEIRPFFENPAGKPAC